MNSAVVLFCLFVSVFVVLLYFIPAFIAQHRHHQSVNAICVLNFFLGWTFVGWVIALVWAFMGNPQAELLQQELVRKQLGK